MFGKSKIDRIFKLRREQQEALKEEKRVQPDAEASDHEDDELLQLPERTREQKKEDRIENVKNFFSMLIAAFIVFLPALLVLVAAFLLFIWLFMRSF